jgi:hypothetical protein
MAVQLEIHSALISISCATSVTERFSLVTVKSSKCARSRMAFNVATRARYSCRDTPASRILTRCCIVSRLAVRRQTTVFVALARRDLPSRAPARTAALRKKYSFRGQIEGCGTSGYRWWLRTEDVRGRPSRSQREEFGAARGCPTLRPRRLSCLLPSCP